MTTNPKVTEDNFAAAFTAVMAMMNGQTYVDSTGTRHVILALPATYTIQGATVTPSENWTPDFILAIVDHGITQKVNDGAASALADTCPASVVGSRTGKDATAARKAWVAQDDNASLVQAARVAGRQAVADHMSNGEWGIVRQAGETIDPAVKGRRSTAYEWMFNAGTPDANAARLAYKAIDATDTSARIAHRDAVWDSHGVTIGAWKLAQFGL